MLVDNKIIKASNDIPIDDKMEISEIIKYFETKHSLEEVKYIPRDFETEDMETVFGFPYMEKNLYTDNYFYYFYEEKGKIIEVKGYDYLLESYSIMGGVDLKDDIVVLYDRDDFEFRIKHKDDLIYKTNLKDHGLDIIEKHNEPRIRTNNRLNIDEMTIVDENPKVELKFVFNNISGEIDDQSREPILTNIDYYVLIKIK